MVFQCRIISPRISLASSKLPNSQASAISPPKTSREYSLGITLSGPAIRAAKNPSSCSTFIALPLLQLLRNSARRSSSASVSGSCWARVFISISGGLSAVTIPPRLAAGSRFDDTSPCAPPALHAGLCPRFWRFFQSVQAGSGTLERSLVVVRRRADQELFRAGSNVGLLVEDG